MKLSAQDRKYLAQVANEIEVQAGYQARGAKMRGLKPHLRRLYAMRALDLRAQARIIRGWLR